MVLDRLKQLSLQVDGTSPIPHPLDPLTTVEIDAAVAIIRAEHGSVRFNAITLWEPRKAEMMAWLADPNNAPRPHRMADAVVIAPGGKIYDGVVDLTEKKVVQWKHTPGVQPLITMEDLQAVEGLMRKDPKIIGQCEILGIPREDMHKSLL
ncbi:peroxisomal copper amine oxidase [Coccidioides immitis H538.4]|uniref:Amine oxidase n=1 Tax=Coccidioides immitis H538.4 TaxID=396776 RepID=A0A0J8RHZ9_COCIT|nr:peroxisomal copper amine oxidase [Coccidioides immitis H538.4]